MNVFSQFPVASQYDAYYETEFGRKVDNIEKSLMKQHLETIPRGTLLDAGCGTGHWTRFFVEQDFQVTGIDNSEAMLQIASQKGIAAKFQQKDAVETGFPDEHFDVVATITMLEFVAQPDDVLKELYRILKPGGYLIAGGSTVILYWEKQPRRIRCFKPLLSLRRMSGSISCSFLASRKLKKEFT